MLLSSIPGGVFAARIPSFSSSNESRSPHHSSSSFVLVDMDVSVNRNNTFFDRNNFSQLNFQAFFYCFIGTSGSVSEGQSGSYSLIHAYCWQRVSCSTCRIRNRCHCHHVVGQLRTTFYLKQIRQTVSMHSCLFKKKVLTYHRNRPLRFQE
jgi:hypothetical protein